MKFTNFAAAAALACATLTAPALAQDAAIAAGASVYGADGNVVGTVDKVEGGNVVVNTGSLSAALPASSFGKGEKGPTIGFTKAQFEAAITAANSQAATQLNAAYVAGADVYSSDGVMLGKIKSVGEDGAAVIELPAGAFSAKKEQVTLRDGKLTFGATKADVDAAVKGQAGAGGASA